jgi:hypothetical protein
MPTSSNTPDGGQYPQATTSPDEVAAPDQTPEEREITDLLGLLQAQATEQGWTSDIVAAGDPTILGLTSPSGRDYSLSLNLTP